MTFVRRNVEGVMLVASLLWSGACVDVIHGAGATRCKANLVATEVLPEEIDLHARMRMQIAGRAVSFDVIAQRRGAALGVVGLGIAGPRIFAVSQLGTDLDFVETSRRARLLAVRALDAL